MKAKIEMKAKITCRYGVTYGVELKGTRGECQRAIGLLRECCCWVCYNRKCDEPRNEVLKDCNNACELFTRRHYCDTALLKTKPTI